MRKRTPHHVIVSFTGQRLTHFGGVYLVQLFFKRLQLRKLLQRDVLFRQRNNRFNTAEEILALVYPIALSIGRIELTQLLKHNGVFHYLTVVTLGALQVPRSEALAVAVVLHAVAIGPKVVLAAIALAGTPVKLAGPHRSA